jgi:phosphate transport system substrate-binding protein
MTVLGLAVAIFLGCNSGGGTGGGAGGGGGKAAGGANRLTGGGSSFVAPMMKKWAGEYNKARGVEVDYTSSGSGNGVTQMTDKKNDFGCTDAPMNAEQIAQAQAKGGEVVHVPLVMGGVVPIYNLPGVEQQLKFTGPVLADIFLGKIKNWNDPALAKINAGVALPDLGISVAHRSDASGTSYIWTDYLSKVSNEWREKVGATTEPKWPVGAGAPKNPGVAQLVSSTKGALGYVELIYALDNKDLKIGAVQNKEGVFVTASLESVTAAAAGLKQVPQDLCFSLTDADGKDAYPISGTVWMVLYTKQPPDKAKALSDFARWLTHEGQDFAKGLHYARLPQQVVEQIDKRLALITQ